MTEDIFFAPSPMPDVNWHRRSDLQLFCTCPFRFTFVKAHPDCERNENTGLGIEGHRVMCDYLNELKEQREWSQPDYLISEGEKSDPAYAQELTDILKKCASSIRYPPGDLLAVERTFKTQDTMPPGQGYQQTLDLLWRKDDVLCVDDWKFGWRHYSDDEARTDRQARWACWLLSVQPEYKDQALFQFRFRMMRHGGMVACASFRREQLQSVPIQIGTAIIELLRTDGDTPPTRPGEHCVPYPCVKDCPIQTAASVEHDSYSMAAALLVAEARVSLLKKALKSYCEERGPVSVGDVEFGVFRSERVTFDSRKKEPHETQEPPQAGPAA